MAGAPEPSLEELLWTAAVARLVLGPRMHVQAPPNLSYDEFPRLLDAGINDWGGDLAGHDRPRQPRGALARDRAAGARDAGRRARARTAAAGLSGVPRTASWLDPAVVPTGARARRRRRPRPRGPLGRRAPPAPIPLRPPSTRSRSTAGDELGEDEIVRLFSAPRRGGAPRLRRRRRAPARGLRRQVTLRRHPEHQLHERLLLPLRLLRVLEGEARREPARPAVPRALEEIARRAEEAWERGAVEVCLQGGIHPGVHRRLLPRGLRGGQGGGAGHPRARVLGARGLAGRGDARRAARRRTSNGCATPGSPRCRGPPPRSSTTRCARVICPDKVSTEQWLEVHDAAHRVGLRSTTTIMFGHVESPRSWARHLLAPARPAAADRRLHRVRAAAVRAHGGADLPAGPRAARARRSARPARARGRRGWRCIRGSRTSRPPG